MSSIKFRHDFNKSLSETSIKFRWQGWGLRFAKRRQRKYVKRFGIACRVTPRRLGGVQQ